MKIENGQPRLSASDLAKHLACRHLTSLDLRAARGETIFEFRWALDEKRGQGIAVDPGFRLLLGRYYDRVKADYPHVVDLPTGRFPKNLRIMQYGISLERRKMDGR